MIETQVGNFEIVKDDNNSFVIADFEKRYVEYLKKYEFIVGDYSQGLLRLKGFNKENTKYIPDYVNEYCALDHQYFVLRNPEFDASFVLEEDKVLEEKKEETKVVTITIGNGVKPKSSEDKNNIQNKKGKNKKRYGNKDQRQRRHDNEQKRNQ